MILFLPLRVAILESECNYKNRKKNYLEKRFLPLGSLLVGYSRLTAVSIAGTDNLVARFVYLRWTLLFLTAMAIARLLPTSTTSRLARVIAV